MAQPFGSLMRKSLLLGIVLAIIALPMAFAGAGLCRSLPCCSPHLAATASQLHGTDCCGTTTCAQRPDVASEYTKTSRVEDQRGLSVLVPLAIAPVVAAMGAPRATGDPLPPAPPPPLQRRMAILSILLI